MIPVVLAGPLRSVRGHFALDTGATWTVVTPSFLASTGYHPTASTGTMPIVTASGVERVRRVTVQSLTALGWPPQQVDVLAHDLPPALGVHGLLGLDFLRDRKLTIDFAAGTIDLA